MSDDPLITWLLWFSLVSVGAMNWTVKMSDNSSECWHPSQIKINSTHIHTHTHKRSRRFVFSRHFYLFEHWEISAAVRCIIITSEHKRAFRRNSRWQSQQRNDEGLKLFSVRMLFLHFLLINLTQLHYHYVYNKWQTVQLIMSGHI